MNMTMIELNKLHPFANHPYQVRDDAEMTALTESVRESGVLSPLIVRSLEGTEEYEIVSGHRRFRAAQIAGLETVPAFIMPMDRNAAAITLVDSNLHREHLLPSEKAFAYKLKAEALNHQGQRTDLTSEQLAPKLSTVQIGEPEQISKDTVKRYIRLTYLIPELLRMVDSGKIAFTPAVHLSYLTEQEQSWVLDEMERNDCTPSVAQAYHLKEKSQAGSLTCGFVEGLLCQPKPNQQERLRIPMERIRKFFPQSYTQAQMEETIVKLCETYYRRRTQREWGGR